MRLFSWASSRLFTTGLGRVGRVAYLNLGGCIGEDWDRRGATEFLSTGDNGDDARIGEEESGDGTDGRLSQEGEKMRFGANDNMFSEFSGFRLCIDRDITDRNERPVRGY